MTHPHGAKLRCAALAMLVVPLLISSCGSDHATSMTQPSPTPATSGTNASWQDSSPRVEEVVQHLHADGSGAEAHALFSDLRQTFVDDGHGVAFSPDILPFRYYWSASAQVTIAICNLGRTVLVCPFYLDGVIKSEDVGRCRVADFYAGPSAIPPTQRP